MTIAEKIVFLRSEKNWSQKELGEYIGVSRDAVGKYERGEMLPPLDIASKIAVVFNVTLDYLAGLTKENSVPNKGALPWELAVLLTKIEKLPKSDRNHIDAVIDAFTKAQLSSTK
ncbi:helix-turn-helix domain-containing protein [Chitinophaga oryziterrae]|uniref:Helix-turn-helix domain-containing protein n=1 Tax=Chitinophaga oryziterrae TaxID=1031224 RepID=A0A6N8J6A0_9BACT|nr:helix-turn-helix transcriptional regulator [Chitinophaga oryziterrae]MVT40795.1 helix-turn-helix domain-containing protein [Chitinophaga oryziterrae]